MNNDKLSRRDFMRNTSLAAVGTITSVLVSTGQADAKQSNSSKILNYNPKMHYRRLGKTGLMISEVGLGGHWKNRNAGRFWDHFANEEVPQDVAKNRTEVVSDCIDCGINYLDITTAAECLSYGAALKGRRDKMYIGADIHTLGPRKSELCNLKDQTHNVEECLRLLKTDYLDIWRPQAKMAGELNTDVEVQVLVETSQKLHKAGKVLHLGISSHTRPWLEHIIETFPQFEMVIFPCSAKTREKGMSPTKGNVEEVDPGHRADQTQSIFKTVLQKNVGVVTIKPFFGGTLFESGRSQNVRFPVMDMGSKQENDLARLTLQCILVNQAITATIPGLSTVYEVENAVQASYTSAVGGLGITQAEKDWLMRITDERWAALPEEYAWLHDWEVV